MVSRLFTKRMPNASVLDFGGSLDTCLDYGGVGEWVLFAYKNGIWPLKKKSVFF